MLGSHGLERVERAHGDVTVDELDDPPVGRCVHLVNVARENNTVGDPAVIATMGTDAELDGATAVIRTYASAAETHRGCPGQYTISRTSFRARICIGKPVTITLAITDHLPTAGRSPGAPVGLAFNGPPHIVSDACTNPTGMDRTNLWVDGGDPGGTNSCTTTSSDFHDTAFGQRWSARVHAGALGAGEGWLWYEYQNR